MIFCKLSCEHFSVLLFEDFLYSTLYWLKVIQSISQKAEKSTVRDTKEGVQIRKKNSKIFEEVIHLKN
jgi:hypothetical protein